MMATKLFLYKNMTVAYWKSENDKIHPRETLFKQNAHIQTLWMYKIISQLLILSRLYTAVQITIVHDAQRGAYGK